MTHGPFILSTSKNGYNKMVQNLKAADVAERRSGAASYPNNTDYINTHKQQLQLQI